MLFNGIYHGTTPIIKIYKNKKVIWSLYDYKDLIGKTYNNFIPYAQLSTGAKKVINSNYNIKINFKDISSYKNVSSENILGSTSFIIKSNNTFSLPLIQNTSINNFLQISFNKSLLRIPDSDLSFIQHKNIISSFNTNLLTKFSNKPALSNKIIFDSYTKLKFKVSEAKRPLIDKAFILIKYFANENIDLAKNILIKKRINIFYSAIRNIRDAKRPLVDIKNNLVYNINADMSDSKNFEAVFNNNLILNAKNELSQAKNIDIGLQNNINFYIKNYFSSSNNILINYINYLQGIQKFNNSNSKNLIILQEEIIRNKIYLQASNSENLRTIIPIKIKNLSILQNPNTNIIKTNDNIKVKSNIIAQIDKTFSIAYDEAIISQVKNTLLNMVKKNKIKCKLNINLQNQVESIELYELSPLSVNNKTSFTTNSKINSKLLYVLELSEKINLTTNSQLDFLESLPVEYLLKIILFSYDLNLESIISITPKINWSSIMNFDVKIFNDLADNLLLSFKAQIKTQNNLNYSELVSSAFNTIISSYHYGNIDFTTLKSVNNILEKILFSNKMQINQTPANAFNLSYCKNKINYEEKMNISSSYVNKIDNKIFSNSYTVLSFGLPGWEYPQWTSKTNLRITQVYDFSWIDENNGSGEII